MFAQKLEDRTLVRVSGSDSETFLENILTCSVLKLEQGTALCGAMLSPQGKILFDFMLSRDDGAFLFDISKETAEEFAKRLGFYKLRADVNVAIQPDAEIFAVWDATEDDVSDRALKDLRHDRLGYRVFGHPEGVGNGDYQEHRVMLGVPEGGKDYEFADAYPHEALMDQFSGVDFKKGCFVGQEVVSRMQHRGSVKKRIVGVEATSPLPSTGTAITAGGKPIGRLGTVSGSRGLALLRLDRAAKARSENIEIAAGAVALQPHLQDWVTFDWPETASTNA